MVKLFISQPMRGRSDEEILQERQEAIEKVQKKCAGKVEVLESFFGDTFKTDKDDNVPLKYLAKSIDLLAKADIAYFCDGWATARGCRIEHDCAVAYGIKTMGDRTGPKYIAVKGYEPATYVGTKMIEAFPAIKAATGEIGYAVKYQDGYESFSPKDVFEEAYRKVGGMNFGIALEWCKKGKKISRSGWNGKGLFVVYQKAYPEGIPCNKNTAEAWGMEEGELFKCNPYLQINTVDGSHAMWVPSINDCLADDWTIVE